MIPNSHFGPCRDEDDDEHMAHHYARYYGPQSRNLRTPQAEPPASTAASAAPGYEDHRSNGHASGYDTGIGHHRPADHDTDTGIAHLLADIPPITADEILSETGTLPAARKDYWLQAWKPSDFARFQPPADFELMGDCHLTRGNLTVLGGWPGIGKSRAAMALAIAGARGEPWLGHPIHAPFRTLVIQCENGPYRLKEELAGVLDGQEHLLDEWLRITPPPPCGLAFSQPGFRQELRALIATFKPGLLVIDPWNRAAHGHKQTVYSAALDAVFQCLPENFADKPAILIVHHLRKKIGETVRKQGRDLLHELAGSYQIGSAARCIFALEAASNDLNDPTVILTCCKNNDGTEGPPSAWLRHDGRFTENREFDMEAFGEGEIKNHAGTRVSFPAIQAALHRMSGETHASAAARLTNAGLCSRATAYRILKQFPDHIVEDENGKLSWKAAHEPSHPSPSA